MEDNKELVTDVTENVEQATEELVDGAKTQTTEEDVNTVDEATVEEESVEEKLYSESELNKRVDELLAEKLGKKTAIIERKLRREYDNKYGDLENVLKAGTGAEDVESITNTFKDFYTKKGIKIPERNNLYDMEAGAEREADEIIKSSFEDVVSITDNLASKGLDGMNPREKIMFHKLASYRENKERENELVSIGAKDVLNNTDFNNFASQFNSNVSIKDVYNMWTKTQPKPKVEQIGSMKNTNTNKIKDYYTPDEARRLTNSDYDNNPELEGIIEKSMKIWYEKGIR